MGLLTRLGSIFSRHPGGTAVSPSDEPRQPTFDEASDAEVVDEHPLDDLPEGEEPDGSVISTRPVNLARPSVRRTKQEWFEELQRNHQELVDLIGKFDAHLDREASRSDRLMQVADALDRALPAIERLSENLGDRMDHAADRIADAVEAGAQRAEQQAEASGRALSGISEHLQTSAAGQVELVTRLAEFRETMSDMARSGAESSRLLSEMSRQGAERQQQMEQRLAATRLWVILGVSAALGVAAGAVAVAVIAITRA